MGYIESIEDQYNEQQQALARHLAERLREMSVGLDGTMTSHALATALIGVGVENACRHLAREDVARWLREAAEGLVEDAPRPNLRLVN